MYYNTRNQELIGNVPLNGYFEDGTLVQGLNLTDAATQKLCGICRNRRIGAHWNVQFK